MNAKLPDPMKRETSERLGEPVLAAGQLRQGNAPSMAGMLTGAALIGLLRPRRSKLLPRHFVLALTTNRIVAFKASGGSPEKRPIDEYEVNIRGEYGSWPRDQISIEDLEEGDQSKQGTLVLAGERFPVARPNLNGDPETDELLGALSA